MSMRSELDYDRTGRAAVGRELDLVGLGRAISRRRWWLIVPALVCFVGAVLFVSTVPPRYTAEAKVLVENGENYFTRPDRTDPLSATLPDDETVQSQIQLVQSRDIARAAVRRLDLKGNVEFDPLARGLDVVSRLTILLGLARDPTTVSPEDRILANYFDRLTVYSVPKSRVIAIEFSAADPDLAARAANTIAELVIEAQSAAKRDSARQAASSLASLVTDLRTRVAEAEGKADAYRTQSGLLQGANNATITNQQLGDLNTQLAQARTSQADAQAKAKIIKAMIAQNRVGEIPDVANNEFIRRISEQRSTLKAEIALQSRTLLPGHPHMQELNAQLADVDAQLRLAGDKMARTLENDGHIAAARVDNLLAALDVQKKTVGTAGVDQVHLNTLETQARLLKDQLEFNTQKYQEAVARENAASTPADVRVISRAMAPQLPSFPKKVPTIAIATIAGLVLALGILVAQELLSGRAFAASDAEAAAVAAPDALPLPVATPMPAPARAMSEAALAAEGEASLLATLDALRDCRVQNHAARALVLPPSPRAAAPAAVIGLARRLSGEGRTILVDLNRASPAVEPRHLALDSYGPGDGEPMGLGELLAGHASFAEVIHRDSQSRLHVVPVGQDPIDGSALDTIGLVLDALGETYDYLVLHAPAPTDPVTLRLAPEADAVVIVHAGDSASAEIAAARDMLARADGPAAVHLVPASVLAPRSAVRRAA
ncbi:GumC family protein [Lichenibacterium ramalinae]|nr:exopolysaccharide transport family protein [Lichenibacterium ramalinae]